MPLVVGEDRRVRRLNIKRWAPPALPRKPTISADRSKKGCTSAQLSRDASTKQFSSDASHGQLSRDCSTKQLGKRDGARQFSRDGGVDQINRQDSAGQLSRDGSLDQINRQNSAGQLSRDGSVGQINRQDSARQLSRDGSIGQINRQDSARQLSRDNAGLLNRLGSANQLNRLSSAGQLSRDSSVDQFSRHGSAKRIGSRQASRGGHSSRLASRQNSRQVGRHTSKECSKDIDAFSWFSPDSWSMLRGAGFRTWGPPSRPSEVSSRPGTSAEGIGAPFLMRDFSKDSLFGDEGADSYTFTSLLPRDARMLAAAIEPFEVGDLKTGSSGSSNVRPVIPKCLHANSVYTRRNMMPRINLGLLTGSAKIAPQPNAVDEVDEEARGDAGDVGSLTGFFTEKPNSMKQSRHPPGPSKRSLFASPSLPPRSATVVIGDLSLQLNASHSRRSVVAVATRTGQASSSTTEAADGQRAVPKRGSIRPLESQEVGSPEQAPMSPGSKTSLVQTPTRAKLSTSYTGKALPVADPGTPLGAGEELRETDVGPAADGAAAVAGVVLASAPQEQKGEEAGLGPVAPGEGGKSRLEGEDMWIDVFKKLKHDGELHKESLLRALELAGFPAPNSSWVKDAVQGITKYATLEKDEFMQFMHNYVARQSRAYAEAFAECDNDGSGEVESAELAELLKSFGIEPLKHVLAEVFREVDKDGTGTLMLQEFEEVMELILSREGFTHREYDDVMSIFQRFDRDGGGSLDTKELISILGWLGYTWTPERVAAIVKEVDIDGSGTVNEREFLMCMRKVRDRELQTIAEAIRQNDTDGSGTVSGGEIINVLKALGYDVPDPIAIQEAARDGGIEPDDDDLDLSEFWQFLTVYRQREGFSANDAALIQEAFQHYDKGKLGEISTLEIGKLLRWLGYPTKFEIQQQFIAKVDIDDSGRLDSGEIQKMVRMYRDRDVQTMIEAFQDHDTEGKGLITQVKAWAGLAASGFGEEQKFPAFPPEEMLPGTEGKGDCIDLDSFLRYGLRVAKAGRDAFRKNGGFSETEVREMELCFKKYDKDNSGDISNKELIFLIEAAFPEMATDTRMRPQLLALMKEVDSDGNGSLDFMDFLRLMKQFREVQDRERVAKEQAAMKDTGFTQQEVGEFRELFLASDDGSGELSLNEATRMIGMICPLGDIFEKQFIEAFREVTARQTRAGVFATEGHRDQADFPEFLWLMKKLLDMNFAHIREKTGAVAARLQGQSSTAAK